MALPKPPVQREFCRNLFDNGANAAARHAYLNTWRTEAIAARMAGTVLTGTGVSGGSSAQFQALAGMTPDDALELIDAARAWADAADVATAISMIAESITETHFENGLMR